VSGETYSYGKHFPKFGKLISQKAFPALLDDASILITKGAPFEIASIVNDAS
jgi:hypothetical protein